MEKISSELRLIISRKFGGKETWDLDVLLNMVFNSRQKSTLVHNSQIERLTLS